MPATIVKYSSQVPAWKRLIDLLCCSMALPLLAIMSLVMSVVVSLFAPGPVFFRQERVGFRGRRFMCFKFRTMVVGADANVHRQHIASLVDAKVPMIKIDAKGDSRLIPGGWLLRATGLDELPQIINILQGDMSIVGPRPCIPYEYEMYEPWQRERFDTVPGLTGLWQVSGKNRTTFEEMMHLDIRYVRRKNWLLDAWIILKTVPAILVQVSDVRRQRKSARPPQLVISSSASDSVSLRS